jgi:hypothetical protein
VPIVPPKRKVEADKAPGGGFSPTDAVPKKPKEPVGPMPTGDPDHVASPSLRRRFKEAFSRLKK